MEGSQVPLSLSQIIILNKIVKYKTKGKEYVKVDKSTLDLLTYFKDLFVADEEKMKFFGGLIFLQDKKVITSIKLN